MVFVLVCIMSVFITLKTIHFLRKAVRTINVNVGSLRHHSRKENTSLSSLHAEPIWKVARYTSAAPMYFTECDNYVDGGVLANNPSESALAAIQKFYREKGCKLPIACVVSVGSGKDPSRDLGSVDALSLGLMRMHDMFRRVQNLVELLTRAVSRLVE